MVNTKVNLCGITLDNPVIPASGTFGYGYEFAELYDINTLGTFSFKGTTKDPRFGNPTPRIAECKSGLINAVGLQNPGVEKVIAEELPKMREVFHKPVMANVSGFAVEDYAYTVEKLDSEDCIGWFEVNVSCPNVHGGGMSFGTDPKAAAEVTAAVRKVTKKPIFIKLTPNVTDIVSIAKACEAAGADGISMINTMLGMRINLRTKKPIIANNNVAAKARLQNQIYNKMSTLLNKCNDVECLFRLEQLLEQIDFCYQTNPQATDQTLKKVEYEFFNVFLEETKIS